MNEKPTTALQLLVNRHSTSVGQPTYDTPKHPLYALRQKGYLKGCTLSTELSHFSNHTIVTVAGLVTSTAKSTKNLGATHFMLEDEWGMIDVVIWDHTAKAQPCACISSEVLKVKGVLMIDNNSVQIIAGKLTDLTSQLATLSAPSRRSQ